MSIPVTIDVRGLTRAANVIPTEKQIATAAYRAINRVNRQDLTRIKKDIGQILNLKAGYIAGKLRERKANSTDLEASVSAEKRGILLSRFPHRQLYRSRKGKRRPAGISVKVLKRGRAQKMRGAFLVPLRNGNGQGIAVREGRSRYPIRVLHGPSISQVFDQIRDGLAPEVQRQLEARFLHEINRQL